MLLYKHFNDHLVKSFNRNFDGLIQPVPFWDFPPTLSLSQSNSFKAFWQYGSIRCKTAHTFIQHLYANSLTNNVL